MQVSDRHRKRLCSARIIPACCGKFESAGHSHKDLRHAEKSRFSARAESRGGGRFRVYLAAIALSPSSSCAHLMRRTFLRLTISHRLSAGKLQTYIQPRKASFGDAPKRAWPTSYLRNLSVTRRSCRYGSSSIKSKWIIRAPRNR